MGYRKDLYCLICQIVLGLPLNHISTGIVGYVKGQKQR